MTKKKDPKDYLKRGRHTVFTKEVLEKLEYLFTMGATNKIACDRTGINPETLTKYQQRNPDFLRKKKMWQASPKLKALITINEHLNDPKIAQWYLERVCKDEFSTAQKVDVNATGINIVVADNKHKEMLEEL